MTRPRCRGSGPRPTCCFPRWQGFGADGLGVLLTGMGEDGVEGLGRIRARGGYTVVEDRSTAVIHGMPGAAERAGAACISLPVHEISLISSGPWRAARFLPRPLAG